MRLLLVSGLLCAAGAIDVRSLRVANLAPRSRPQLPWNFDHYWSGRPLDPRIAPTCGNGVVDKGIQSPWLNFADFPTNETGMFRFVGDEMCDDGNRLDGDGCAADCMDFDAMTSPCVVAVDRALRYESVLEGGGATYAVALDGIYRLDYTVSGLQATLQFPKSVPSVASLLDGHVLYYATAAGQVTAVSVGSSWPVLFTRQAPTTAIQGRALLFLSGTTVQLLAVSATSATLSDATTGALLDSKPGTYAPCTMPADTSLTCGSVRIIAANNALTVAPLAWPQTNLWTKAVLEGLSPTLQMVVDPTETLVERADGHLSTGNGYAVYAQIVYARILRGVRSTFVRDVGQGGVYAGSWPAMYVATGGTDQCGPHGACAMDVPLDYSVLEARMGDRTWNNALEEVAASAPTVDAIDWRAFSSAVAKSPVYLVSVRGNSAIWAVTQDKIYEISRNGAKAKVNGKWREGCAVHAQALGASSRPSCAADVPPSRWPAASFRPRQCRWFSQWWSPMPGWGTPAPAGGAWCRPPTRPRP